MNIAGIINRQIAKTSPQTPFASLLRKMRNMPSRMLYVVGPEGTLLGQVSVNDILGVMLPFYLDSNLARAVSMDEEFAAQVLADNQAKTARDIMSRPAHVLAEDSHLLEAMALLKENAVLAVPVVDAAGRLSGEVTRRAILATLTGLLAPLDQDT